MAPKPKPDAAPEADVAEVIPTRFKNTSPLGALDVPAIGRVVKSGEVFDVRDDVAQLLAAQPEHFTPAVGEEVGIPADETEGAADGHAA